MHKILQKPANQRLIKRLKLSAFLVTITFKNQKQTMQTIEERSTAINESLADTTVLNQEGEHEQQPDSAPAEEVQVEAPVEAEIQQQEEPKPAADERKPFQIFNSKLGKEYKFGLRGEATQIVQTQLETEVDFKAMFSNVKETKEQKERRQALENLMKNIFTDEQFKDKKCYSDHVLKPKKLSDFKDGLEDKRCYQCGNQFLLDQDPEETTEKKTKVSFSKDDDFKIYNSDDEEQAVTKKKSRNSQNEYIMLLCDHSDCKGSFYSYCRNCLLKQSDKMKIDDVPQPLAFSKYPFQKFSGRTEKWTCSSIYMKGNNVPKEYCNCLMGLTPDITQKNFTDMRAEYVKATDSELRFCQACYNLWKQFEFDKAIDYTQFTLPESQVGKEKAQQDAGDKEARSKSMKKSRIFKTAGEHDDHGCEGVFQRMETLDSSTGKSGQDMLQQVMEQFAQNSFVKTLSKSTTTIQRFNLAKDKHLKDFPPTMRAKFDDISHTDSNSFQMKKCEFQGGYRIVVQAWETVSFKEGKEPTINASTLRIFDPTDNLKEKDSIILQTFPQSVSLDNPENLTSYLQFLNFIFYFKRIWVSSEDAKPKSEEQPENQEAPKDEDAGEQDKKEEDKKDEEKKEENKVEGVEEKTVDEAAAKAPKADDAGFSYLQLFMYNLDTFKEKPVQNFAILEELGYNWALFNTHFGDCFMTYSSNETNNRKIFGNLEEATKLLTDDYKKDPANNAKIVDLNTQTQVFYIGNEFYYINQQIDEDGYCAYSTYNQNVFTEVFNELPDQLQETVTKETVKSYEPDYRLEKFFKANYFLLYKVCDNTENLFEKLKDTKIKCFFGYSEDCAKQEMEIEKLASQYDYYCYGCYNYSTIKFKCAKCEQARCLKCIQSQLNKDLPPEKNLMKYNFIYRMDKPQQYVKYYQFESNVPTILLKSVEAVQGQFKEKHNYPNLKMNNKAEFQVKKVDKKDASKAKAPPTQVEIAQSKQSGDKFNFRNLLIVKENTSSFLQTFHYPNEEIVQAPFENKVLEQFKRQAEEKAKQEKNKKMEEAAKPAEEEPKTEEAEKAEEAEKVKSEKADSEKAASEKADSEKAASEKAPSEKAESEKAESEAQNEGGENEEAEIQEENDAKPENQKKEGEEAPKAEPEPDLTPEEIKELEFKHQGFVKCTRYFEPLQQFKAEIWGVKIQNCKLPNQEETCTYTQYVFQNPGGSTYLLYPQFNDEKLQAGDGDCLTAKTYVDYLQEKAAKQTQDQSFRATLLTNARTISEKLEKDFGIKDCYQYNFSYFESNFYQDLIWSNSEEIFTIQILRMNLQNQIYDDNFYKQPQIGTKINPNAEKFNGDQLWDLMNNNKGQVNYFNSVYKNLLYRNNDMACKLFDDEGNEKYVEEYLSQYDKVYIEGPQGHILPFDIVEVDPKDKENDFKTKVGNVQVKFMARTEKNIWFVLFVKDVYWMLLQKPLDFIKEDQTAGIINKNSEVQVFQNVKNQEVVLKKFKIDEFLSLKKDEHEKFLNNNFIFEEWVDNRYKYTTLTMIYFHTNPKTYERECMSILTIDLDQKDQLTTHLLKMQFKQKMMSYLYPDDMKFLRITERKPFKDGFKTQYAMINMFYTPQQQYMYEFELKEISANQEQQKAKNSYISVIRKSITMLAPKLSKKTYEYKTYYNYLFPIYDEAQQNLQGYSKINKGYYDVGSFITPTYKQVKERKCKYETDIMYLDCRKISRQGLEQGEFFLYLDAQFKPDINENSQFDEYDQKHLLDQALYSMFHMVPYSFKHYLSQIGTKLDVNKTSLFKKREELFGNTLCDIFVKEPKMIAQALVADTSANHYDNSLAEDMYANSSVEELAELKSIEHFKGNSVYYLQCNFTQENILNRAISEKAFKTATLILDHVFNLEGRNVYQIEIMKALPVILAEDRIASKIVRFFNLPDYEDKQENTLSFEQLLNEENTPAFSTQQWFVHETQTYDYNNYKVELVEQLNNIAEKRSKELQEKRLADDSQKKAGDDDNDAEILYDVKNTFIDFRAMICAMKFQEFRTTGHYEVKFDNYTLSQMVENMSSNKAFYNCTSVQRLIDHHFSQSQAKLINQVIFFVSLYYLPFMCSLLFLEDDQWFWRIVLNGSSLFTICYFFSIELIQIRMDGLKDYVSGSGIWNFFDFTQFIGYLIFYIINCCYGFQFKSGNEQQDLVSPSQEKPTFLVILQSYLIMTGFMKLLFFMRLDQDYGALVMMVQSTVSQVGPFIKFFYLWILFFTFSYYNLALDVDDSEYPNVNKFVGYFLMTYRDSVGDISPPGYGAAWTKDKSVNPYILYTIWLTWLVNQFMCLIVMLNFLIAVISQVYDNVVAEQATILYLNRASLNKEYFQIQSYYNNTNMFGVLVFQIEAKDNADEEEDTMVGFVQSIKNFITRQNGVLTKKVDSLNQQIIDSQNTLTASMNLKMKNIELELAKNQAELIKQLTQIKNETNEHKVARNMWTKVSHADNNSQHH